MRTVIGNVRGRMSVAQAPGTNGSLCEIKLQDSVVVGIGHENVTIQRGKSARLVQLGLLDCPQTRAGLSRPQ